MIDNNDNRVKYYDNVLDNFTSFNNIVYNIHDKVHAKLYNIALSGLLKKIYQDSQSSDTYEVWAANFYKTHKIIEIKNDDYIKASVVRIYDCVYPYNKNTYQLSNYWPNTFEERKKYLKMLMLDEETLKYSEIIRIDFINGTCLLRNKLNAFEYTVPFEYIDKTIPLSEDLIFDNVLLKNIANE